MKKVMVFGTFDILHPGHLNFFKQARKFGNFLIAVIARDKTVLKIKGRLPKNNEKKRLKNLKNINLIDKAVLGGLKDKYEIIKKFRPDIICLGYDQKAFTEELKNKIKDFGLKIKIIRLKSYKPEIYKSSKIIENHRSVGAIIIKNNKILMIDRKKYPFGWACPAGHIDSGEIPEKALIREVQEETNLKILKYKLLIHKYVSWNKCSRGVKGHNWYIYEILEFKGKIKQNSAEEKNIGWMTAGEIKKLKLEKIWRHWFGVLSL